MMTCANCQNPKAWHVVSRYDEKEGVVVDCCDACGLEGAGDGIPDVYFNRAGQTFASLCDEMGRPIPIESKRHKKEVMDRLGVREAGDIVNGAKYGTKTWIEGTRAWRKKQFDKDRPMIRQVAKEYRERHA